MQKQIIRILNEHAKLRFTDLKDKLGISKIVLSQHLQFLENEGSIEYDKIGREKYYALSKNILEIPQKRIQIFTERVQSYLELRIDELMPLTTLEVLEQLSRKLGALVLFTFIKSVQTGENWFEASDMREYRPEILFHITNKIYGHYKQPDELYDHIEGSRFDFVEINNVILGESNDEIRLEKIYRSLKKLYPEEIQVLEHLYSNPRSGYSKATIK